MEIKFKGYAPLIRQLRTDKGWRVEIDVSQDQYDAIKELPKVPDESILDITIDVQNSMTTSKPKKEDVDFPDDEPELD